MVGSEVRRIGD